jgi:diacylglycerol kinase family enzyme
MRYIGIFNRDGGTFRTMDLNAFAAKAAATFTAHGHSLESRVIAGRDLAAELKRAVTDTDALLVGGGDGTISAAAAAAYAHGIPLAVLPAGTMNLFARSLGVPLNLDAALEAVAAGEVGAVDIATANGRPFVHQFSVGIHSKLVKLREQLNYRSRIGKMAASSRAAAGAVLNPPSFTVEITSAHGLERRRVAGLSVTNNPLDEGHLPIADRLDRGVLGIYLVRPLTPRSAMRLGLGLVRGKFKSLPEIVDREVREATLRFPRKKPGALAVVDGELSILSGRVDLKIHPAALKVVLPKAAADAAGQTPELTAA